MSSNLKSTILNADAIVFDMDGLTDNVAAVEAAWGKVARDLKLDTGYVISITHGNRAIENLAHFRPHIKEHEQHDQVEAFEKLVLEYTDTYSKSGPRSRAWEESFFSRRSSSPSPTSDLSPSDSLSPSPNFSPIPSLASSRRASLTSIETSDYRRSFASSASSSLPSLPEAMEYEYEEAVDITEHDSFDNELSFDDLKHRLLQIQQSSMGRDIDTAWKLEAGGVDRSIRILPGIQKIVNSIPKSRYAVTTNGRRTYAHGAMTRIGMTPPQVIITADDHRLKAGKPSPDTFLLAASSLGFDPSKCVIFDDSPSGIHAGVASGATVIAVCSSQERPQIESCGAHYLVENMEDVKCEVEEDGSLRITVQA